MSGQQQQVPPDLTTRESTPATSETPASIGEKAPTTVDDFRALSQPQLEDTLLGAMEDCWDKTSPRTGHPSYLIYLAAKFEFDRRVEEGSKKPEDAEVSL